MEKQFYLENGMEAVEAVYSEFPLEEYNTNPFIQAMPPLMDKKAIIKKLVFPVSFQEQERHLDSMYRLHMIHRLYKLFQPLPRHIEVWNTLFSLIYQGYIARNPIDKEYIRFLNQTGKQLINRTYDINNQTSFRTTANCATLIGYSGMGKTTSVNRILNNIPQVIVHNGYKNQHFNQIQLSHLTLQTPHSSSLKALTLQFFLKVDEILGTNNYQRNVARNVSLDAMLPQMGQVANNIGLGLLVIDEIQHLQNRAIRQMMNYFVTLMNSFGVPILFIGTPAAYAIFQQEFRIARRVSGNGEIVWNNMQNDKEFRFFMESVWKYQWNRKVVPLTDEMINTFYEETQGVSDLIIKLFIKIQELAISTGKEEFNVNMLKKVAREQFKLMKPMLEAIKSKNPYKISQYEDLLKIDFEQQPSFINERINIKSKPKVLPQTLSKSSKGMIRVPENNKTISNTNEYEESDLRLLYRKRSDDTTTYQLLLDNNWIDDMSMWSD